MRVLVCGGRDFDDGYVLECTLNRLKIPPTHIIEGGASGADHLAALWAGFHSVPHTTFQADWKAHGRAAGPIRNQQMIDEGKPDLVIAFPGGKGTADMVRKARAAGVDVIEV